MPPKKVEFEDLIMRSLRETAEVSVRSIANAADLGTVSETERRLIRRALKSLEERQLIVARGNGRSRVYVLVEQTAKPQENSVAAADNPTAFRGVALSTRAKAVLDYVSQTINERLPVGYDQEFLRSYRPNETYYLTAEQRERLLNLGRVEPIERPAGTYARNILARLLIDLSWNSSRLEGNTYSLLETKRLIELGETATGKDMSDAQMILNHKEAIEYIVESAEDEQITSREVYSIHALLSENLLGDPAASGRLRSIAVGISGTTYVPLENPHLIREFFDLFIDKLNRIADPFEQSLFSIVHLSYLQAFEDVNKRTARLVANIPLVRKNLRPLSFTEVDGGAYVSALLGVYERNDVSLIGDLYMWSYARSSQRYTAIQQSMGEPNLLKLRHRALIKTIVRAIIIDKVTGVEAVQHIRDFVETSGIPESDRSALFTLIENELISLHDGNIARYRIRPSEFQAWKELQGSQPGGFSL